jgi:hypothetical protein
MKRGPALALLASITTYPRRWSEWVSGYAEVAVFLFVLIVGTVVLRIRRML